MILFQDDVYGDINLRTIRFFQIVEDSEKSSPNKHVTIAEKNEVNYRNESLVKSIPYDS